MPRLPEACLVDVLHPIADEIWGQPCLAYHVQPVLGPEARRHLCRLQQSAAAHWPSPLHLCPREAFHVTIYPLVPVPGSFDRQSYWDSIAESSTATVEALCADAPAFTLQFFRLMVTSNAIIAVARDATGLVEAIRRRVVETLPPPPGREPVHYDLIHSTLARYRMPDPVPLAVAERIESLPVDIAVPVDRIRIFRETLFPCLQGEELASFPLGRRPSSSRGAAGETGTV